MSIMVQLGIEMPYERVGTTLAMPRLNWTCIHKKRTCSCTNSLKRQAAVECGLRPNMNCEVCGMRIAIELQ